MGNTYFNECVAFALKSRNIEANTLEDANLRIFHRTTINPKSTFSAIGKGGIIIPTVKGSLFGIECESICTVLIAVNRVAKEVLLYVPTADSTEYFNIEDFVSSWTEAGGICTTAFAQDEKTYTPKPLNLDNVVLPEELNAIGEQIAENAHNIWAFERQSEGWTYGNERNDSKLLSPDMIPYDQLLESEKDYDRQMAMGTLKQLYALGYKVVKN